MKTRFKLAAGALTALPVLAVAAPAHARVDPSFSGGLRYTTWITTDWETMANLPMRRVMRVPGYGWRASFCITAGNRYDAGAFYGFGSGAVEATVVASVDGPAGECTVPVPAAQLAVHVSPLYIGHDGNVSWLANRGCVGSASSLRSSVLVARHGGAQCAAPVNGPGAPMFATGGYSVSMVVAGQVFADQPTSSFNVQWNNWPDRRI